MKFDNFYFTFLFLLKIIASKSAFITNGNACDPANEANADADDELKCNTASDFKCHTKLKRCLKEEDTAGQACGENVFIVCSEDNMICQLDNGNSKCKIKQGQQNCNPDTTTGKVQAADCVKDAFCATDRCTCKTADHARGFVCSAAKLKKGDFGCTEVAHCEDGLACGEDNKCATASGARGLRPSYLLIAVCFIITRLLL